ncbi:MAG: SPOR domain-containing protein [Candidatus Krumholzibacteriota bacterium]|nr:SPOR domain-containing protein [Candidatus Krumholzibacteriota bacterium]
MKKFLISLSLLAVILMLFTQITASVPYSLIKVKRHFDQVEYTDAKEELLKLIDDLRGKNYYYGKLFQARLETNIGKSTKIYKEIIASSGNPVSFIARTELAKIYYSLEKYNRALKLLVNIPVSSGSSIRMEAFYFRGLCFKESGALRKARKDFLRVDKGEYLYRSYMERAQLDMEEGNYKGAIEKYETIGGIHSNPLAAFKLGECLEITGDSQKAFEVYRSLKKLFPKSIESAKAIDKMRILVSMKNKEKGQGVAESMGRAVNEEDKITNKPDEYTIQFGAFQNRQNASSVSSKLSRLFPHVRVESKYITSDTKLFRVRVGRYNERTSAEEDSLLATDKLGLTCRILTIN